ncbi:DHA2 family efflux MFS transporter permease subunit [Shimazuella sp. AN120528]|uniref:DHA2 family efflux MFS transporter permease subunit n=1 Tax=Shimazuella soli TaxID=1892854 RepID=UPI001F0E77AB|nr:DHA2 family efflux MFS transporter permease subunit [Shimazuella soli]MCH5584405.1 DHA2 family efflux MFS transporter permease subunit [Shimazuella soli]
MPEGQSRRLVLAVSIIAVFMAILDTSIVNVAIPKMMAVFSVDTKEIQWVITSYTLVVGTIIPVTGYVTERFGFKKIFIFSLTVFTLGSLLCGLAWSNETMIIFRIVQALGGGALMPVSQAMLFRLFPREKRGQVMGLFGISIMFAPAIGPTLSGYIIEYLDWRLIFFINVPIGVAVTLIAIISFKELEHHTQQKFDVTGFITSTIGFSTLLYGIGLVPEKGWSDDEVLFFVGIGVVSLLVFIIIEWIKKDPMLNLRLLKSPVFTISQIITSLTSVIVFVPLFIFPIFLQNIAGLTALQTGLLLLPQALITGLMMPVAGMLFDKIGARWLAIVGMGITAYALYLTTQLDASTSFSTITVWLILRGIGISLVMMPISTAGMNAVPNHMVAQATALSNAVRQIASSFGIAWATLLLSNQQLFHAATYSDQYNVFSGISQGIVSQIQHVYMGLGQSISQAKASALVYISGQIQVHSMVQAMDDVFYVSMWLALFALVISIFIGKKEEVKKEGTVTK